MSYQANLRVWRGDDESGDLRDYTVDVNEGETAPRECREEDS
jgi:succinate dehydrogenase / fumarate reductase iron-sulfur subunit